MKNGFTVTCNNCGEKVDYINQDGNIVVIILNDYDTHEIEIECMKCGDKDSNC